jgi:hypothetical protein
MTAAGPSERLGAALRGSPPELAALPPTSFVEMRLVYLYSAGTVSRSIPSSARVIMPDEHYEHPRLAAIYDLFSGWSWDRDFYLAFAGEPPKRVRSGPALALRTRAGLL